MHSHKLIYAVLFTHLDIVPIRRGYNLTTDNVKCFPHMVENVIQMETPTRTFFFSAKTEEIMASWYKHLNEAICNEDTPIEDPVSWDLKIGLKIMLCSTAFFVCIIR